MTNYETIINNYITKHNITKDNVDHVLRSIGYPSFFNDITIGCLGLRRHDETKSQQTTSALLYVPETVKNTLLSNFNIIYISNLYFGIIASGKIEFNYENFHVFLEELFTLRTKLKKEFIINHDPYIELKIYIIKIYMNCVYGMIDNSSSIISTKIYNPRELIVETARNIMLKTISFFINKTIPIYYVNIDELFIPHIDDTILCDAINFFKSNLNTYTNISISGICNENTSLHGYILSKKQFIICNADKTRTMGLKLVDNDKVLVENKKYFGRNYKDIFPEYAIW